MFAYKERVKQKEKLELSLREPTPFCRKRFRKSGLSLLSTDFFSTKSFWHHKSYKTFNLPNRYTFCYFLLKLQPIVVRNLFSNKFFKPITQCDIFFCNKNDYWTCQVLICLAKFRYSVFEWLQKTLLNFLKEFKISKTSIMICSSRIQTRLFENLKLKFMFWDKCQ